MISYERAVEVILSLAQPLPRCKVALDQALGLVLAAPLRARHDSPRFRQSAMDGWAVRAADTTHASQSRPVTLRIVGSIHAGDAAPTTVSAGTAVCIMTGAPVPRGADAIVCKEDGQELDEGVRVFEPVVLGENIRNQGEEFRRGDLVLPAGTRITPPVVGALAAFGFATVSVHRRPKVAVVVTGNELTEPGKPLRRGAIYDANLSALLAGLEELGIAERRAVRCADELDALQRSVRTALQWSDVVITAGGVSVGERDLMKPVFEQLGVNTVYWRVAIKPGMPNYFGTWCGRTGQGRTSGRRVLVFGLPGNPVAALLSFHEFVKPALLRLLGLRGLPQRVFRAALQADLAKKAGRLEWIRAVAVSANGQWTVTPVGGQGSHMVGGLAQANCVIVFPQNATHLRAGQQVLVQPLDWRS